MPAPRTRFLIVLALLLPAAWSTSLPATRAGETEFAALKPGEYHGIWHSDKVVFVIFGPGRFEGRSFKFTGKLANDGSITIDREKEDDPQTGHAKAPKTEKGHLIWEGRTTGADLDKNQVLPFELRLPLPK
jgi:hypothetical protein